MRDPNVDYNRKYLKSKGKVDKYKLDLDYVSYERNKMNKSPLLKQVEMRFPES